MKKCLLILLTALLLCAGPPGSAATRALLAACSEFQSYPSLGREASGNLQLLTSVLFRAVSDLESVSVEDGTLTGPEKLAGSIEAAFADASETDWNLLYLCSHGIQTDDPDAPCALILSDGEQEALLTPNELYAMLHGIPGQKLVILDACHSGGFIGHGFDAGQDFRSPFLQDDSIHVMTSSAANESSWYFDSPSLENGAVSFFAAAIVRGLGFFGESEADRNLDGRITLSELYDHLTEAVSSSDCQLLSARPDRCVLFSRVETNRTKPLSAFTYGKRLLDPQSPVFSFAFTVLQASSVSYRLTPFSNGRWDWEHSLLIGENTLLSPGRKQQSIEIGKPDGADGAYVLLQVYATAQGLLTLCEETLLAFPAETQTLSASVSEAKPGDRETEIRIVCPSPALLSVRILNENGKTVRTLRSDRLTHPLSGSSLCLYWDGLDRKGDPVPPGEYTLLCEADNGESTLRSTYPIQRLE